MQSLLCFGHTELFVACSQLPTSEIGKKVVGHEEAVMAVRRWWGGGENRSQPLLTGGTAGGTAGGMDMAASRIKKS